MPQIPSQAKFTQRQMDLGSHGSPLELAFVQPAHAAFDNRFKYWITLLCEEVHSKCANTVSNGSQKLLICTTIFWKLQLELVLYDLIMPKFTHNIY